MASTASLAVTNLRSARATVWMCQVKSTALHIFFWFSKFSFAFRVARTALRGQLLDDVGFTMSSKFFTWTKGDRRNATEALQSGGVVPIPVECLKIKGMDYARSAKVRELPPPMELANGYSQDGTEQA